jgi:hypothetical protein
LDDYKTMDKPVLLLKDSSWCNLRCFDLVH